ncbi:conserved hypothetical protein [Tenacibaculum sp. 190524A02b]|uniref:Phage portal protein n=1 Tax=Tenacibaculum vairaonense TaxID=3137860 RepID=A0ABP1F5Q7_9FLAO
MKKVQGVYFGKNSISITSKEVKQSPTTVKIKEVSGDFGKGKIAPWGSDNKYPQKFLDQVNLNGAASIGLGILKAVHYGSGITFFKNEKDEKGKRKKVIQYIEDYPEINDFWKRNKMPKFWTAEIADLETWNWGAPEFIVSKDFKKITQVRRQKTAWCRKELINPKSGFSENMYINANWEDEETKSEFVSQVASVDSYWSAEEIREYCKSKKIHKFIMPIHYTMMDETYYNKPSWHCIYNNGWLEVSNSIPKYKKALFENQVNLKYIIYIADEYFENEYGDDWEAFDVDKRQKIKEELISAIDDHLAGNASAGRSLYSKKYKTSDGDWVKGIEVEAIDNKLKEGSYLPDAQAANEEIFNALGTDSTLSGGTPGGMGAGSGSDKRIAFTILTALFKPKRETTLEIWELLKAFNGWDQDLQAGFENIVLTTLDKNPNGQKNVTT